MSVTDCPWQKVVGPEGVIIAEGRLVTVTSCEVESDPQLLVTVTVYVPAVLTEMDGAMEPVDHKNELPPDAVSVTALPWQKVTVPLGEMDATGMVFTTTVWLAVEVPHEFDADTV